MGSLQGGGSGSLGRGGQVWERGGTHRTAEGLDVGPGEGAPRAAVGSEVSDMRVRTDSPGGEAGMRARRGGALWGGERVRPGRGGSQGSRSQREAARDRRVPGGEQRPPGGITDTGCITHDM